MTLPESLYTGNGKHWTYIDSPDVEAVPGKRLQALVLRKVLIQRGVSSAEHAALFLAPSLAGLHDPMKMTDMAVAAERLAYAVKNREQILIYGDYDVDGTTAVSILLIYLKSLNANVSYYIPDRVDEGYGISEAAVDLIGSKDIDVMVTVDCGISANQQVADIQALHQERGHTLDIIITDHHQPRSDGIPACLAVVNPHRESDQYPFKQLCGAGIAFKLVQAIGQHFNQPKAHLNFLDLAALATIADIVSLTGENRMIAAHGIELMKKGNRPGLTALMEVASVSPDKIDATRIGFSVAPRLNAAGRMGDAKRAVALLTSDHAEQAIQLARELEHENQTRRQTQDAIFSEAVNLIHSDPMSDARKVHVVWGSEWHHGVIGIVASKLVDLFQKPVFVFSAGEKEAVGSGRSVSGFHLFRAMEQMADGMVRFGGHAQAGGATVETALLNRFRDRMNAIAVQEMTQEMENPPLEIAAELPLDAINLETARQLAKLEPCGEGNRIPIFSIHGVQVVEALPTADGKHLRLKVRKEGKLMEAIAFGDGPLVEHLATGQLIDMAFALECNEWKGRESLKLRVADLRMAASEIERNHLYLKTASRLESLDCDDKWIYNSIKHSGLTPQQALPVEQDYSAVYRFLGKRDMKGLTRADLFRMANQMREAGSAEMQYLKFFSSLLVFDELGLISFTLNADGTYELICDPEPVKVNLGDSELVQLMTTVLTAE